MRNLPAGNPTEAGLKPFWLSLAAMYLALAIACVILAQRYGIPAAVGAPVAAAFAWQISLYWAAVFERTRMRIAARLPGARLAAALAVASVAPYCIYSLPTGVFSLGAAAKLAALCAAAAFAYVVLPTREPRFVRQDAAVAAILAYPMISGLSPLLRHVCAAVPGCLSRFPVISGLSPLFRDVYRGFDSPLHRMESLGKLMLIPLGLFVFLSLRKLPGAGFHLVPQRRDWRPALENFLLGTPLIAAAALATGHVRWNPLFDDPCGMLIEAAGKLLAGFAGDFDFHAVGGLLFEAIKKTTFSVASEGLLIEAAGKLLGIYMTTALAEEFLLRGVVQNLLARRTGRPAQAQAVAALLFAAAHLGRGGFPNWPYFATTVVLGWFCGRAYAKSGSITPAMMTHALVVAVQPLFFQ